MRRRLGRSIAFAITFATGCSDDVAADSESGTDGGSTSLASTSTSSTAATGDPEAGTSGESSSGGEESESTGAPASECPNIDIGSAVGEAVAMGSTAVSGDDLYSICTSFSGEASSSDFVVQWQPPETGPFRFRVDADFGTQLSFWSPGDDGACAADELRCAAYFDPGETRAVFFLDSDAPMLIAIEGLDGNSGDVTLSIDPLPTGTCPDETVQDFGEDVAAGTTVEGAGFDVELPCVFGTPAEDYIVEFEAPQAGGYEFTIAEGTLEFPAMAVVAGGCDGAVTVCSPQGRVGRFLEEGESVILAFAGDDEGPREFQFDAEYAPIDTNCADVDLADAVGVNVASGDPNQGDDDFALSCAIPGDFADATHEFTAPEAGTYRFDTEGSALDTVLALSGPVCGLNAEYLCNDDTGETLQSAAALDLDAGQQVLITIEGFDGLAGTYELNVQTNTTPGGSCCDAAGAAGCDVAAVEECVCADFSDCCELNWDANCAATARANCDAACVSP